MNKKILTLAAVAGLAAGSYVMYKKMKEVTITGTYRCFATGDDFGCATSDVIVHLDAPIDHICRDDLVVQEYKQVPGKDDPMNVQIVTVPRTILDAYVCDEEGQEVFTASPYVHIELAISPDEGSILFFNMATMYNQYAFPYELTIRLAKNAKVTSDGVVIHRLKIDRLYTDMETSADEFMEGHFDDGQGMAYDYVSYTPMNESDRLIVWLHGLGEGGTAFTDPYVTVLANKVTALAQEPFQKTVGDCHVLSIQCPTFWMDQDGSGDLMSLQDAHGESFYLPSLIACIDDYVKRVGAKKICIAGCSNGGYMTMLLALACGHKYQAYVPICEALKDEYITDEDIQVLRDLPMFFIYSEDDSTVNPDLYERPTIERLKAAGAKQLAYYEAEGVYDCSGRFKKEDGTPYQYHGHWSWIYFDNDEAVDQRTGQTVFTWIKNVFNGSINE